MSNDFWQTIGDFVAAEMRGAELERERIIKLLEADICPNATWDCCDRACWAYKDAVALIKGENK